MKKYTQITNEERKKIAILINEHKSNREIAKILGRAVSTIGRELKRNEAPPGQYWPDTANVLAKERRRRGCIIDNNSELKDHILNKLRSHYWTPEQIAGDLKNNQTALPYVSHETIYAWIYAKGQKDDKLWKFLTRHKAKRGLRKSKAKGVVRIIPNRVSIHERPKIVATNKEFGHWEGDLMSCIKGSQHILVLRERTTMFTKSVVLPSKHAHVAANAIMHLLEILPKKARKTLTMDNGGEFARHFEVAKALQIETYFCDPYKSWQKGGVENTNGRLRRDLPRNTNIKSMTKEEFDETIENYNTTPRKSLHWKTPLQVFNEKLHRVALRA